jgi:hypothetical protein
MIYLLFFMIYGEQNVHLKLGMPSSHALGLGDARLKLTRPICLSSNFPRLSILPLGRDSTVLPSADNANRYTPF